MANVERDALERQARAIRLAAQELEKFARGADEDRNLLLPGSMPLIFIQRKLGSIRHELDTLFARFGKGDR